MTTLGLFSSPKFASVGDPYRDPHKRNQGRDMKKGAKFNCGNAGNRGQRGRRGCFSRFKYGFAGDRFEEPAKRRRRQRHEEKQKMVERVGSRGVFRPTNPAKKKSAGSSGDGYGTFGGNVAYIDDGRYHKSTRLQARHEKQSLTKAMLGTTIPRCPGCSHVLLRRVCAARRFISS